MVHLLLICFDFSRYEIDPRPEDELGPRLPPRDNDINDARQLFDEMKENDVNQYIRENWMDNIEGNIDDQIVDAYATALGEAEEARDEYIFFFDQHFG